MDIDILISPERDNAQKVLNALEEFGFGNAGIGIDALSTEGSVITLGEQPNQVDLLTSMSSTDAARIIDNSVAGTMAGIKLKFVNLQDLINAKKEAGRPKDIADLDELEKINSK